MPDTTTPDKFDAALLHDLPRCPNAGTWACPDCGCGCINCCECDDDECEGCGNDERDCECVRR